MLAVASLAASGLIVGTAPVTNARAPVAQMATIGQSLSSMDGPDIYWGPDGPLQNPMKEESDFKEFDSFSTFLAACAQHGVDLDQPDITVFAPANVACDEFTSVYGPLTKAVCEYHVVKGVKNQDALGSGLPTLEGSEITFRRMFRKNFIDNAFTGTKESPPRSSYTGNIKADNGMIHMLNEVIYPGWSESSGGYGSTGDPAATRV